MKKQIFTTLFFWLVCLTLSAQNPQSSSESPSLQVSLITCGPGEELYSKFGHSALRIRDVSQGLDVIYNYGLFDFNAPNFYLNFVKGKLRYFLGKHDTESFIASFVREDRWVREQVLDIDEKAVLELLQRLEENYRPENRYYLYDFFYANCATKIRDLLLEVSEGSLTYPYGQAYSNKSYRDLIAENLPVNDWGGWGIDLALGSLIDTPTSNFQAQFLPEYTADQLSTAQWNGRSAVRKDHYLSDKTQTDLVPLSFNPWGPLTGGMVLMLLVWLTRTNKKYRLMTHGFLNLISGVIGVVLVLLWTATDHQTTAWNAHLFWAQPWLILAPWLISSKNNSHRISRLLVLWGIGVCLVMWVLNIQSFHWMMLPIWGAIIMSHMFTFKTKP